MKKKKKAKEGSVQDRVANMTLPTRPSEPVTDLGECSLMIFGEKGIGKTTLAAQFPNAFFIFTEPSGKFLRLRGRLISHWLEFVKLGDLLMRDERYNKTTVIDTVDNLYELCFDYMCNEVLYIEHPHDEKDRGKSWKQISKEFQRQTLRLFPETSGKGLLLVSHAIEREITTLSGDTFSKKIPSMGASSNKILTPLVDVLGYYHKRGHDSFLQISLDEYVEAKCRCEENFLAKNGQKVQQIPMGKSAKESYRNFVSAFNNKQAQKGGEEDEVVYGTKKKKKKKR